MKPVLIVDDDPQIRRALAEAIQRLGYVAAACDCGEEALKRLSAEGASLIVTDMRMPRMDGLTFMKEARRQNGKVPFLVITGFGSIENAVETMKIGAVDYLMKPFSVDTLKKAVTAVIGKNGGGRDIVTENREMQKILKMAANLAVSDITVLIYGESGTGKELLARYIHAKSQRADRPFVAVNCAAIPDNLLESELFGHEKGAFTGAAERKTGKFELANGGTILLDEVGEMPMLLQAKLLRVLQEREIDRIGGRHPIPVDARVIATTNKELLRECAEGRFREDLFYRLNVFPIKVPPLRDRPEDIILLSHHFLKRFAAVAGKDFEGFSSEGLQYLTSRHWRGNIRELENTIHRAVFVCGGSTVARDDLLIESEAKPSGICGKIREMEKRLILDTLRQVDGNRTKAAKLLGVSVRTIRNKLTEYGQMAMPDG